jgi:hypothetical protein
MGLHAVSFARGSAGARTLPLASWLTLWAAVFFDVTRAANARAAHGRRREAFNDQDRTAPLSVDVSSHSGHRLHLHDNDSLQGDAAPVARYGHCAAVLDGRMYMLGGAPINGSLSNELWLFTPSPSSGSWSRVSTRGHAPPPIEGQCSRWVTRIDRPSTLHTTPTQSIRIEWRDDSCNLVQLPIEESCTLWQLATPQVLIGATFGTLCNR